MQHEAIILDTETTHVDEPEVIELAWMEVNFSAPLGVLLAGGISQRFRPTKPISWGAVATHHIVPADLVDRFPSCDAASSLPSATYWVGHNVDFDWKALSSPPVKRICTLAMSRAIWPELDSHKLVAMTYFLEGATPATRAKVQGAHGALVDIALCAGILARIIRDRGLSSWAEVYAFSEECRIPKIMTFGKFKGQPVSNVDRGWANWYQRQDDTDQFLIEALRRARKL